MLRALYVIAHPSITRVTGWISQQEAKLLLG